MKLQTLIKSLKPGFSNRKSRRHAGRHAGLPVPAVESLEPRALLAATIDIAPSTTSVAAAAESTVSTNVNFGIELTDSSVPPLSFQVRMHYDSSELTPDLNAITSSAFAPAGYQLETSINDESRLADDGRDETDKFVLLSWGERSDQTPFPVSNENTPLTLFIASFQTSSTFDGTQVDFRGPSVLVTGNTDPADRSLVALNLTPLALTLQANASPAINPVTPTSVAENQTTAIAVVASDSDGDTLTYSLTGTDAALFSIGNTGVVTFNAAPNFESPGDDDGDNIHNFTVAVSDGNGGSATQDVVVTVTDVNENPVITSSGSASVVENQTAGYVVTATDDDNDTLSYAITGGADAALFAINSSTGAVTFNTAPDFEAPADTDGDNSYGIVVSVTDGNSGSATQNVVIAVSDVIENSFPTIDSDADVSVVENQTAAIDVNASDVDGDVLTYAISGGADSALFTINSSTGAVTFNAAPDFEAPADADADNIYEVAVTVTDGNGGSATQNATITVTRTTPPVVATVDQFPESVRPTVSWSAVSGAAAYEVWFARIAPSQSRIFTSSSTVTTTTWTPPADLTPAVYRVWTRADNGLWSAPQTFEIRPNLIGPQEPTFEKRPEFTWEAVPFATGYQIFVRTTDPSFGNNGDLVVSDIPDNTTSWTPNVDLPNGRIRWWVRTSDATGNRGWSSVGQATIGGRTTVIAATASQITWAAVAGAGRYILHVQNMDNGEIGIRENELTETTFMSPQPLASGNYRIWVKAINAATDSFQDGFWSSPLTISV